MKGKTKTILAIVLAVAIVAVAAVGTVTFLKDNGEAAAAEEENTRTLPVAGSDEGTNSGNQGNVPENLNEGENTPEANNPDAQPNGETLTPGTAENGTNPTGTPGTTGTNTPAETRTPAGTGRTGTTGTTPAEAPAEPEATTIEQERLVSQTLNWSNISLDANIGDRNVNYTNLKYTVNYITVGEDENTVESETGKAPYGTTVTVSDEDIDSHCPEGYKLDEESELTTEIGPNEDENVINVYYVPRTDLTGIVNYYLENTETKLADSKELSELTFGTTVTEDAKDLKDQGYDLVSEKTQTITVAVEGNEINFYYTPRTDLTGIVNYYLEGTETKVADSKELKDLTFGSKVTEEAIDLRDKGYDKVEPTTQEITVAVEGNEINFYYTPRTDLTGIVNYYLEGTETKVADSKELKDLTFGSKVKEEAIDLRDKGYDKVEPTTQEITVAVEGNEINFYYTPRTDLTGIVNYYLEGTTTKVADSKELKDLTFGSKVTEKAIDLRDKGYDKVEPTTQEITVAVEGNEINFYYTPRTDLTGIVNYYLEGTETKVADSKELKDLTFGSKVKEEAIDLRDKGYDKVEPTTQEITVAVERNEINFYYTPRTDLTGIVNYYLEGTETKVADSKELKDLTFGSKVTEEAIDLRDKGYDKVEPTTQEITVAVERNEINFYYTPRTDLTGIVNYYLEGTETKVADSKELKDLTFGSKVKEEAIDLRDKGYDKVEPTTQEITVAVEGNEINFYYTPRTDLTGIVNYYLEGTETKVADSKELKDLTFGSKVKEEAIDLRDKGYDKVEPTTQEITVTVEGNEINFYYTPRTDLTGIVNYYLEGTETKVADSKELKDLTFGSKVTEEAIDLKDKGYYKVEPTTATITVAVEGNVINFYYTPRTDLEYSVEYYFETLNGDFVNNERLKQNSLNNPATFLQEITEKDIDMPETIRGYILDTTRTATTDEDGKLPLVIGVDSNSNIIRVYYKRNNFNYEIRYYKDFIKDDTLIDTIKESALFGETITADTTLFLPEGYEFKGTTAPSMVISVSDNILNVVYQKGKFDYTVNYYKDEVKEENFLNKVEDEAEFGSTVTADTTLYVPEGYKFEGTAPSMVIKVSGNVIDVVYVKDNFDYTVNYYKDEVKEENFLNKVEDEAEFGSTVTADTTLYVPTGYKFEGTAPSMVIKVSGNVIDVVYVKDEEQTKKMTYTVEYYKDNNEKPTDTDKVTKDVWVNATTMPVDVENINVTNKYTGYSFKETNPKQIPTEIAANGVIKVYYTINSYKLTVKYVYEDGKTAATTYTDELNYEEAYTVTSPEITGYSADIKVVNGTMPADNVVVTVVYKINKYNYTINYYYESDASTATETYHNKTFILMDNETVEADFGTKVTSYDSSKLLQGYYEEGVEKLPLTVSEDETKNIVNVYFGKSPIDYVVNYYINDVKDNAKSYTGTSKVGNKITLQDVNKYAAEYVLDTEKTTVKENSPLVIKVIPSTGVNPNVIDVYYYTPADLEAKKVVKIGNKTLTDENTIAVNSVITYEITVENKGGYASENVTLEDYVPAGTQLTEGQNLTTTTGEDGKTLITWDLGTIEGFGKRTVSFNVKVTGDALGETERNILTNIATAKTSSEEINSNPTNNVVVKPIQTKANVGTAVNIATNYIFVVDISYSMNDSLDRDSDDTIRYTPEENSRMAAMQSALNSFTSELFKTENDCTFTLVTFCNTASYVGTYNYSTKANLTTAINNLTADSGTNIKAGLQEGNKHLQSSNNVVVLLSDGEPIGWGVEKNGSNIYRDCVKGKNASYYCIGFGKEANSPSKNAYKILDLIDDNTSNNTVKTSNSSSELIQNLTEVQYAEQDPQDVELETKQNNVFDLGGKELAADRNVTITYKDENGSNQTVSYTRQQIIDGGTPFTYDSTNKKLIFNVTNFVNCTDIIVEYYV